MESKAGPERRKEGEEPEARQPDAGEGLPVWPFQVFNEFLGLSLERTGWIHVDLKGWETVTCRKLRRQLPLTPVNLVTQPFHKHCANHKP